VARKRGPSARAQRDTGLVVEIRRVYAENLFVYGADKVWAQLNRENIPVARCTVERLMRAEGLSGARRGKAFQVTTRTDDRLERPADLVERRFRAPAPNRLWVADLTYVKNRQRAGADLSGLVHHSDRACNTSVCATPSGSPTTTSSRRSDRRATASITPSPRASTVSTSGS
jgi:transposase InsO family protein